MARNGISIPSNLKLQELKHVYTALNTLDMSTSAVNYKKLIGLQIIYKISMLSMVVTV